MLAHKPGKANAATDFLSRIQTDPSESIDLQFVDSISMKQIETDMKANTPDASMLMIEVSNSNGTDELKFLTPKDLIENIQPNDALSNH